MNWVTVQKMNILHEVAAFDVVREVCEVWNSMLRIV